MNATVATICIQYGSISDRMDASKTILQDFSMWLFMCLHTISGWGYYWRHGDKCFWCKINGDDHQTEMQKPPPPSTIKNEIIMYSWPFWYNQNLLLLLNTLAQCFEWGIFNVMCICIHISIYIHTLNVNLNLLRGISNCDTRELY